MCPIFFSFFFHCSFSSSITFFISQDLSLIFSNHMLIHDVHSIYFHIVIISICMQVYLGCVKKAALQTRATCWCSVVPEQPDHCMASLGLTESSWNQWRLISWSESAQVAHVRRSVFSQCAHLLQTTSSLWIRSEPR